MPSPAPLKRPFDVTLTIFNNSPATFRFILFVLNSPRLVPETPSGTLSFPSFTVDIQLDWRIHLEMTEIESVGQQAQGPLTCMVDSISLRYFSVAGHQSLTGLVYSPQVVV